jgi:hypothetical protein
MLLLMKLVMVHGRAQAGFDSQSIRKEWVRALDQGLRSGLGKLPENAAVEFPFYGDELKRLVDEVRTPFIDDRDELAFRLALLTEIAEGAGINKTELAREFAVEEKGIQNWRLVHAILRLLDRIQGVNSRFIDLFTHDVYVYLTQSKVRERIHAIVEAAFEDGPCVVVAHSLGTIIAYNVLRGGTGNCARLITVGAPLGLKAIKRHLEQPLGHPTNVRHWFNAMDPRDVVALYPLDATNFNVRPAIENKTDVRNNTENRHGIVGYLADPVVAAKVVEFL